MRLDKLKIGTERPGDKQRFKNLKNVEIDFDENEWITVVIGWNGTGKSNVLEALATLFRDLIMEKDQWGNKDKPSFSYQLRYICHGKSINIDADPYREKDAYKISYFSFQTDAAEAEQSQSKEFEETSVTKHQPIKLSEFKKKKDEFLPKYIFGYYSGHSDRMYEVFRPYLEKYDSDLRNGDDPGLRQLFYARPVHSQFTLLAFMLNDDVFVQEFLENHFGIDKEVGIDSILFVLSQPSWKSKASDGDPRFWNARGVVKDFLSRLYEISLAPIRIKRRTQTSLWNKATLEYLYLYVKDLPTLKTLVGDKAPREFFRDLESTYVSELIDEVRIRVKLKNNDGTVIFRELSEGEQQLLTVLGLLRFTSEDESLFLLDEPDTHLNPQWSVDYFKYLKLFVNSGRRGDEASSHIVLNTHNPLAIAELSREQVQILYRDSEYSTISAQLPEHDPRGMGYSGIVTSDMFGLASSLDKRTQRRLELFRALASKKDKTSIENLRYAVIQKWLEADRFKLNQRDDDYMRYLEARNEILKREVDTDDYQELVKFAISIDAKARKRISDEAIKTMLEEEQN